MKNMFLNLEAGNISLDTYRNPAAEATTANDIIENVDSAQTLTASVVVFKGAMLLVDQAYHLCSPSLPCTWAQDAAIIENGEIVEGKMLWDFSHWDNYDEIEDASDFDWDNEDCAEFVAH